ncbi:GNAT family N-acetyltransferase [Zophobihabitans entericus]|uniref:GNAT family N-acetyltransferase n=1 Tax=Zophobihabitans entericus TaxID=1635327 RepID=A0A6G9I8L7_9GAMM|nr:GNAT family N-acetyltransferase [Zophobihabitans entericus]QIQ20556.1 GNAT family N-acetyltransferase [Zophobihabitans entericus]
METTAAKVFESLPDHFLAKLPDTIAGNDLDIYRQSILKNECWVALHKSIIIGFICTEQIESENTIHIKELDVDFDYQGKGVGKQLLQFIITQARTDNKKVTLTTFKNVPWNAPLYTKFGFHILGESELNLRLITILEKETELGLPKEERCAMRLESDTVN